MSGSGSPAGADSGATPPRAADYGAMQRYIIDPNGCIVGTLPAQ